MAVLTVLTVLFSKTVDIQQTQKIFKVPPRGTPLIKRRYLLQEKIKIGLSASNFEKKYFLNFPLYSIYRNKEVDLFN